MNQPNAPRRREKSGNLKEESRNLKEESRNLKEESRDPNAALRRLEGGLPGFDEGGTPAVARRRKADGTCP